MITSFKYTLKMYDITVFNFCDYFLRIKVIVLYGQSVESRMSDVANFNRILENDSRYQL